MFVFRIFLCPPLLLYQVKFQLSEYLREKQLEAEAIKSQRQRSNAVYFSPYEKKAAIRVTPAALWLIL